MSGETKDRERPNKGQPLRYAWKRPPFLEASA